MKKTVKPARMMRSRRYRPKRTYRRTYRKKLGEGSCLSGTSYGEPVKISQVFKYVKADGVPIFWNEEGVQVSTGFQATDLKVIPGSHIGLYQRLSLYKHWRITGVKYHFYKDSLSPDNGAVAYANYAGDFDALHSKVVYDPTLGPAPGVGSNNAQQFGNWITQQKGKLLPTLRGRKKTVFCKATMLKKVEYRTASVGVDQAEEQLVKFPWLSSDPVQSSKYSTGSCTVYMPIIEIKPLLNNPTEVTLTGIGTAAEEARKLLSARFQWYYRPQLYWQVKGKYYDGLLAGVPDIADKSEDIVEFPIKTENVEDDLAMSDF